MTDLERRALLGDKQAQEKCTRNGIALPCPMCGKPQEIDFRIDKVHHSKSMCLFSNKFIELDDWNTRPAPPIGRCVDCAYGIPYKDEHIMCKGRWTDKTYDDFCSDFKPREDKHD